jgi:CDP-paratose 2-epimerase
VETKDVTDSVLSMINLRAANAMPKLLVTGSSGLIGSEVVDYFCKLGWQVDGVDNNMRAEFFGPGGDTRWNQLRLQNTHKRFRHHELDIRDRRGVDTLIETLRPSLIVHAAA